MRKFEMILLMLLMVVGGTSPAMAADDLVETTIQVTAKAGSATSARKVILDKAMEQAARTKVVELLGAEKYQKNRAYVDGLIVEQAAKFIPVATPGTPQSIGNGEYRMPVTMKISVSSLRAVLQKSGLLYDTDGPAKVLPMFGVVDLVHSLAYHWWTSDPQPEKKFLVQLNRSFHQALHKELSANGFYAYRPLEFPMKNQLPEAFQVERFRSDDYKFIGEHLKADILVRGEVKLIRSNQVSGAYTTDIKLTALQASNSRVIGEVSRRYETDPGSFELSVRNRLEPLYEDIAKDLAVQVLEAWQSGTFGATLIQVQVDITPGYEKVTAFKDLMTAKIPELKSIRERKFESRRVVFEVDFSGGAQEFANRLGRLAQADFPYAVSDVEENKVILRPR